MSDDVKRTRGRPRRAIPSVWVRGRVSEPVAAELQLRCASPSYVYQTRYGSISQILEAALKLYFEQNPFKVDADEPQNP